MSLIKNWSLGLFFSACAVSCYLIEQAFSLKIGVWWGFLGLAFVITGLYRLGSRFLFRQGKSSIFAGFYGILTLILKLMWEVFYIWIGLKYLATPAGLLIGGVLALASFYVWLIRIRKFQT